MPFRPQADLLCLLFVPMILWGAFGCDSVGEADDGACSRAPLSCNDVPEGQRCPATCETPMWTPGECKEGVAQRQELLGQMHISLPEPLSYEENPPASGSHRPMWACWGEYAYLPPTRWLHNLEHGGIAILYNPCVGTDVVDALRTLAKSIEPDDAGAFRWILTPYPDLPSAISIVSWRWVYSSACFREDEMREFIRQHYRNGPEDIRRSGDFSEGYLGR